MLTTQFSSFQPYATKELSRYISILACFPKDLETLKLIKIHPAIMADKEFLGDYVPGTIITWAKNCKSTYGINKHYLKLGS